jgi:hypothetical protein
VVPTFTAAAAVVAATDHVASLPTSLVDVLGGRLGHDPALRAFRALLVRAAGSRSGPRIRRR